MTFLHVLGLGFVNIDLPRAKTSPPPTEFATSDTFKTAIDIYYSEFEETQLLRGIELPLEMYGRVPANLKRQLEQMYNKADDLRFHFVNRAQQKRTSPKAEESAK